MAILNTKTTSKDPMEIPASLRRNGQATPSVDEFLAKIAALEAQVASKTSIKLKISEKGATSFAPLTHIDTPNWPFRYGTVVRNP